MKLSNEKIINDVAVLKDLSQRPLPVKVSYAIAKNINKIESELKVYNRERAKLIDKYAEKDEEGNLLADASGQYTIKPEYQEAWEKDVKELLAIENEIDIHKFKLDLLEGHSMKPSEIMAIEYMIEE